MGFNSYLANELHRQHLNLSRPAWDTIDSDIHMFSDSVHSVTLSGFLNSIFLNVYDRSPANLSNAISVYRDSCRRALRSASVSRCTSPAEADVILEELTNQYAKGLIERFLSFPKGEGRKFRLNNDAVRLLHSLPDDSYNCRIYNRPGKLLKAIFETYAQCSFIERERIMFRERIERIEMASHLKALLRVGLLNGCSYDLIPYKILADTSSHFNYVAGYSAATGTHDFIASSFRLSRMTEIQEIYRGSFQLTAAQKKELEANISSKGVAFLLRDMITAQILLTEEGIRKYDTQLHLRPPYTRVHANGIYEFQSTKEQLLYYFFKFGADAVVLSPKELRQEFKQMYQKAANNYEDTSEG